MGQVSTLSITFMEVHDGHQPLSRTCRSADQTDLSEEQLYQLASDFGLGMGNMEATCGALVGAGLVAGLVTSGKGTVRLTRQISEHFKTTCDAVICKELKGIGTGKVLCPCDRCVRNAVLAYAEVCGLSS